MSLEAWGDEGNVPEHGRDTAIYQELVSIGNKFQRWIENNRNDFSNDEEHQAARAILEAIEQLEERLNQPL